MEQLFNISFSAWPRGDCALPQPCRTFAPCQKSTPSQFGDFPGAMVARTSTIRQPRMEIRSFRQPAIQAQSPRHKPTNRKWSGVMTERWRGGGTYVIDFTISWGFGERQEKTEWCGPMD
jgi:hypothetical protein